MIEMTAFEKAWAIVKNKPCEDCGESSDYGVCDDCWENRQNTPQEGEQHGRLPPHLHDTPLHDEGLDQIARGMVVDWNDGNVNHPDMSQALYNLYDHYDSETGQPISK